MMRKLFVFLFISITIFIYGQENDILLIKNLDPANYKSSWASEYYNVSHSILEFASENYINGLLDYTLEENQQINKFDNLKKNWISIGLNPALLLFGCFLNYERFLNLKYSIGLNIYWSSTLYSVTMDEWQNIGFNIFFRFFPMGRYFHLGMGLGGMINDFYSMGIKDSKKRILLLTLDPVIGWKIYFDKNNGIFIPLGIEWPIPITKMKKDYYFLNGRVYFGVGYGF